MRAFIGISVPPNAGIEAVLKRLEGRPQLKAVEKENLHINLKFLGEIDDAKADEIKKILDGLAGFGAFEVVLKGVGAFPNQNFVKVIWAGARSDKLVSLAGLVEKECVRIGFAAEHDYVPHLTLARAKQRLPDDLKNIFGDNDFGVFEAGEVSLVKSELTAQGPKYTTVHSVKL